MRRARRVEIVLSAGAFVSPLPSQIEWAFIRLNAN